MATNTNPTGFLTAVARIHLSHLFRDPFVAAAFRAAEDDGLAPSLVEVDSPRALDGGVAEAVLAMAGLSDEAIRVERYPDQQIPNPKAVKAHTAAAIRR